MKIIADFHIHSRYSRATSKDMDIPALSQWAKWKGVDLVGTGDFTHALWLAGLKEQLKPKSYGLFEHDGVNFILTAEVCNIFYVNNVAKKIHIVLFAPSFETVEKINKKFAYFGKLEADGRPILNVAAEEMVKIVLDIDENCLIVPAHIWTPHFSLFGANSGFDTIEECFGKQTENIFALETGLSADPAMCWRLSALDRFNLISNSDSHSPAKLAREANVFDCEMDYNEILGALKTKDKSKFLYTIEFFPQEGKYHWDGHRMCQVSMSPPDTIKNNLRCPKCGRNVTVGVMHRVEKLADRPEGIQPDNAPGFKNLIPLVEIIADAKQKGVDTQGVQNEYKQAIHRLGSELDILLNIGQNELSQALSPKIVNGIMNVRTGNVTIAPGYDGVYGKITACEETGETEKQMELF